MIGQLVSIAFKLMGSLALFMYGMELSSNGIQRAAGDRLQKTVNLMTKNRFIAVITGTIITILIQSSSATTVMVVSFVNAGLLNLFQAIGVIMGANIGTTLTGWIIAVVGIGKFSIALVAVPIFGVGFFLSLVKNRGDSVIGYGEGLMGFAMIFLGLDFLSKAIPTPSPAIIAWLQNFSTGGVLTTILCVIVGALFTMLVHASSATLAVVIGFATKDVLTFEMAAAITLGANIGTTIDSFLASFGTNVNGKRAAWAHILFNIVGTLWVIAAFKPFLLLLFAITPGELTKETIGLHIALMHTMFNLANTIVLLPFIRRYANALERFIKPSKDENELAQLVYRPSPLLGSPELNIAKVRSDIAQLTGVAENLFARFREDLTSQSKWSDEEIEYYRRYREYSGSMKDGISKALIEIAQQDIADKTRDNISVLLHLINELDAISGGCNSMSGMLAKGMRKKTILTAEQVAQMEPVMRLVGEFLAFISPKMGKPLSADDLAKAEELENCIDAWRAELKKLARKRIKAGAEVKLELLYIDLIRHIEKIGDNAWSVAVNLRELK